MKRYLLLIFAASLLFGCKDEPVHDVQYYLDHPEERAATVSECENDPGRMALRPNCVNAGEAAKKAMFQGSSMPKVRF